MARSPRHDILFEPLEVGNRVFRNRFYGVPHGYGAGPAYPMSHVEHRAIQAQGGWAVACTGVTATSVDWEGQTMERLMSEDDIPPFHAMCSAVHKHGALAGIEFGHAGADSPNRHLRHVTIGPSQFASWRRPNVIAKEMELEDIERVQNDTLREHIRAAGISWQTSTTIEEIHAGGVQAIGDSGRKLDIQADGIVLVTNRFSCDGLYKELKTKEEELRKEGITGLYSIGDCVAPRSIADVIFDGHRLAREIDSANPAFPLPVRKDGNHLLPPAKN